LAEILDDTLETPEAEPAFILEARDEPDENPADLQRLLIRRQ
jgi:hypothetical protein